MILLVILLYYQDYHGYKLKKIIPPIQTSFFEIVMRGTSGTKVCEKFEIYGCPGKSPMLRFLYQYLLLYLWYESEYGSSDYMYMQTYIFMAAVSITEHFSTRAVVGDP